MDIEPILAVPSNLKTCSWPIFFTILICGIWQFFSKERRVHIAEGRALKLALLGLASRDDLLLAYRELLGDLAEREARRRTDEENRASMLNRFENGDKAFRQRVVQYFHLNVVA